jgi:integrase
MPSRPLTEQESQTILSNLTNSRDRCLYLLGLHTGFRISELLSLTLDDVLEYNEIKDRVTVARCNMKGKNSSRSVPLHPNARQALKEYLNGNESIWNSLHSNGRLFSLSRFQAHRIIANAKTKAQLKGKISTHSWRKTFGMNIYQRTNKNIVAVQRALGHRSLSSTTHYLSVDQDEIDRAILGE